MSDLTLEYQAPRRAPSHDYHLGLVALLALALVSLAMALHGSNMAVSGYENQMETTNAG